ncbi:MAG: RsmB/NOP family class I SAM-dependent RNA methyltransferase [Bacteroidota bacterium]
MRYIWQHIAAILSTYDGSLPLTHFLKHYCKQHPKLGSRDRKILSAMAYSWYRCSKAVGRPSPEATAGEAVETQIKACLKLCNVTVPMPDMDVAVPAFDAAALFPHEVAFSEGIVQNEWLQSMITQPDLFIRIRKEKEKIEQILNQHAIPYRYLSDTCMALPNGAKIDTLLQPDTYVVQDASSQETGKYFSPARNETWWDCCAGAGGKSILLKDIAPAVNLTVSDRRETILYNLRQRFKLYGLKQPEDLAMDITKRGTVDLVLGNRMFDNIICDAPCTGSGTWARTPEQLYFFDPAIVQQYAATQLAVATNAAAHLKPGGRLIYITCSVFRAENEDVVSRIAAEAGLTVMEEHSINGTGKRADSMFVVVMRKEE